MGFLSVLPLKTPVFRTKNTNLCDWRQKSYCAAMLFLFSDGWG